MLARPRFAALLMLSLCSLACDPGQSAAPGELDEGPTPGYADPSSADMVPTYTALADEDLEGVRERGLELWRMERATVLADAAIEDLPGGGEALVIALANIDPVGSSGEVTYFRWPVSALDDGRAQAEEALRWVRVSLTLDPDESFEAQRLDDRPTDYEARVLTAVLLAREAAEREYPGVRFYSHAFREQVEGGAQTRVYLMGRDEQAPDLEFSVRDPKSTKRKRRGEPPQLGGQRLHLAPGRAQALPVETPLSPPGPPAMARAVARASALDQPVGVVDGTGAEYTIAPHTGALTRRRP